MSPKAMGLYLFLSLFVVALLTQVTSIAYVSGCVLLVTLFLPRD